MQQVLEVKSKAMKTTESKLKEQEIVVGKRETHIQEEEEKLKSRKNYLNVKETNLTKRESIIANQDKIIYEVEEENKNMAKSLNILERDAKKYKIMEKEFRDLKTACGLD